MQCSVGVTPEGVPFFGYLISFSADDLRALHLDPRVWVVQLGSNSLFPHAFATAFQAPEANDRTTESVDALGELVSQAHRALLIGDLRALDILMSEIRSEATKVTLELPLQPKEA